MPDDRETGRKQYKEDLFKTKAYEEFKSSMDTGVIVESTGLGTINGPKALLDSHDPPQKPDVLAEPRAVNSSLDHTECDDKLMRSMNEERVVAMSEDLGSKSSRKRCNIRSLMKNTIIKMKAAIPFRSHSLLRFRIPRFRGLMHPEDRNGVGSTEKEALSCGGAQDTFSLSELARTHSCSAPAIITMMPKEDPQESVFHSECCIGCSWMSEECSLAFESDEMEESDSLERDQASAKMHHDIGSMSESDHDSSTFEFPDDASSELTTMERMTVGPILRYIQSLDHGALAKEGDESICTDRSSTGKAVRKDNGPKTVQNIPRTRKKSESNAHMDLRYLYFLKKVCNLTKKDARNYCRDQNRLLVERSIRNRAELLPKTQYASEIKQDSIIIHTLSNIKDRTNNLSGGGAEEVGDGETRNSVTLRRVSEIKDLRVPAYNKDEFGYLVYKHGDGLVNIAKGMEMGLKDVIMIYYLEYHSRDLEITGSLLEKYVEEEWTITDRILFEESFMKYGNKFSKFIINKSEEDLRIYYRYYLKNYIPMNWTEEERAMFSQLFSAYKKDWVLMQKNFPNKSANDLKVFYGSYFKKLDEKERIRESQLAGAWGEVGKRGRRSGEAT